MSKLNAFTVEIEIDRSKAEVWEIIFKRFGEANNFNPLIIASHYEAGPIGEVGTERKCEITPGNWVHEKISAVRGEMDEMDIEILDGGLPMVAEMKATFQLKAIDANRTKVTLIGGGAHQTCIDVCHHEGADDQQVSRNANRFEVPHGDRWIGVRRKHQGNQENIYTREQGI